MTEENKNPIPHDEYAPRLPEGVRRVEAQRAEEVYSGEEQDTSEDLQRLAGVAEPRWRKLGKQATDFVARSLETGGSLRWDPKDGETRSDEHEE